MVIEALSFYISGIQDGQLVTTSSVDSDDSEDSGDQGQGQFPDSTDLKNKQSRRESEDLHSGSPVTFNRQTSKVLNPRVAIVTIKMVVVLGCQYVHWTSQVVVVIKDSLH